MKLTDLIESHDKQIFDTAPDEVWDKCISPGAASVLFTSALIKLPHSQRRYKDIEDFICTDPIAAMEYACYYLQRRWPKAEPIIATEPLAAYSYAQHLMYGDFPMGEAVIRKDTNLWIQYISARAKHKEKVRLGLQ